MAHEVGVLETLELYKRNRVRKVRKCLKCNQDFNSPQMGVRFCIKCKTINSTFRVSVIRYELILT